MKKVYKKAIQSQARAIRLATKMIENPKLKNERSYSPEEMNLLSNNNRRFMGIQSKFKGMTDGKVAAFYRKHFNYDDNRGLCPNYAPWWHGNVYSFKEAANTFAKL